MNTLTQDQRKTLIEANSTQSDGRGKVETVICWSQALDAAFAKGIALGVAQEREECAKVCEALPNSDYYGYGNDGESYAEAIRARK